MGLIQYYAGHTLVKLAVKYGGCQSLKVSRVFNKIYTICVDDQNREIGLLPEIAGVALRYFLEIFFGDKGFVGSSPLGNVLQKQIGILV